MTTLPRLIGLTLAGLVFGLTMTSCSLLVSKKRQLDRFVHNFNVALNSKEWKKAASYMTEDFEYTPYKGSSYGNQSARAYMKMLHDQKPTNLILTVNKIEEISETKMLVTATRQVRQASATETINRFWEITMLWELDSQGKDWKLKEIKQISDIRRARS